MKRIWAYLQNPFKQITFTVIGCGGTGSYFLKELARMAVAYGKLRNIGIHVIAVDPDVITQANVGRQLFSNSEIGMNKAECLISKINRTYGLNWEAYPHAFKGTYADNGWLMSNFVVSCVDKVEARKAIAKCIFIHGSVIYNQNTMNDEVYRKNFFWFDIGNTKNKGQVIIGSPVTPNIMELYPDLQEDDTDTPSCSLAEALEKQDFFVNPFAAIYAAKEVWKILTEFKLSCAGLYFNLENYNTNVIPLNANSFNIRNARRRSKSRRHYKDSQRSGES